MPSVSITTVKVNQHLAPYIHMTNPNEPHLVICWHFIRQYHLPELGVAQPAGTILALGQGGAASLNCTKTGATTSRVGAMTPCKQVWRRVAMQTHPPPPLPAHRKQRTALYTKTLYLCKNILPSCNFPEESKNGRHVQVDDHNYVIFWLSTKRKLPPSLPSDKPEVVTQGEHGLSWHNTAPFLLKH